ncbi:hypothetical protein C0J52_19926 [Blattella germanica]|nr:hypothetical protein C0J52_19926 [Blattella germanica]
MLFSPYDQRITTQPQLFNYQFMFRYSLQIIFIFLPALILNNIQFQFVVIIIYEVYI